MNGVNKISNQNINTSISIEEYNGLQVKYKLALKKVRSILDLIKTEFETNPNHHNLIAKIDSRIKSIDSATEKLIRKKMPLNIQAIEENLDDIAGIRVVCYFKNDLFKLIEILKKEKTIKIIEEEDYIIKHPKPSGYRSYHLTVEVPIEDHINNTINYVKVEIQIRTLLMDLFASLEHKFKYKKNYLFTEEILSQIKALADFTKAIDDDILNEIEPLITPSRQTFPGYNDNITRRINSAMPKYKTAMAKLNSDVKNIYDDFKYYGEDSPIEKIESRLKSPEDIYEKLSSLGYDITEFNIDNHITDIVGTRIVCTFLSDVETIVERIKRYASSKEFGLEIVDEKDYITHPKENGYSSYHMIVKIPIYIENHIEYIFSEIQIRTKIMDIWASLERQCCYKKECLPEVREMLKWFSSVCRYLDKECNELINQLKTTATPPKNDYATKGNPRLRRMRLAPNKSS